MPHLLYADESSVTGRALTTALGIPGSSRVPERQVDTLIRWGSTRAVPRRPQHIINNGRSVALASNKLEALRKLDQEGIRVPTVLLPGEVNRHSPFPLMGRAVRHLGGTDIVLCMQLSDIPRAVATGCSYFTQYIPVQAEYRVHVFGEDVIKTSQKINTNPEGEFRPWVRNLAAGYTFRITQRPLGQRNKGVAVDAVKTLGLTFGAVDLIVGDDNAAYILEINTAPGLIENGLRRYVRKFQEALGMEVTDVELPEGVQDDDNLEEAA